MDQDNKTPTGAPSEDTTSALFVSARKKQLQQQEAERIAKQKEAERIAAEAEVRRLEREVEERRRKAEEDARMAEAEAEQKRRQADEDARRIAEEARAKKEQAAEDPDSFLGAQPQKKEVKLPRISLPQMSKPQNKDSGVAAPSKTKQPINKKLLLIGGGALGAIVLVIVLIIAISSGNGNGNVAVNAPNTRPSPGPAASSMDITATFFYYDGDEDDDSVWFYSNGTMVIYYSAVGEEETHDYTLDGDTIIVHGSLYGRQPPFLFTIVSENLLIDQDGDHFVSRDSAYGGSYGDGEDREFHELNSGIYFVYPTGWTAQQTDQTTTAFAPVFVSQHEWSDDFMLIYNYTPEFHDFMAAGRSGMDNLIEDFAVHFLSDRGYDVRDIYNVAFGDAFYTAFGNEVIAMRGENGHSYFVFLIVKIFTEPQQLIAVAIETSSESATNELLVIIDSIDLR